MRLLTLLLFCVAGNSTFAEDEDDLLPIVPEGFVVDVVAKEPLVSNPCVMAFDPLGRVFIGQGPQWRAPTPDTPGDRVDILVDDNDDGVADRVKTFADGFNCIQGLAWRGGDLWVANAPDLTIVRDLDGDDEADEYVRVYTGLGSLEHGLHGLNFGPDGKLYMSKGNSKGYNRLDQLAPKPFRDLWGLPSPDGAPDYTPINAVSKNEYRRKYHTPQDDWGQQGGILRCDPDGRNLEIVSKGYRNPWDVTFDDGFDWLGTDNDQTEGDKIFTPFYGAHFGWGHAWSYHWTGEGHLPTVPASAPLFEGSGTGVIHYHATHFPPEHRSVFFIADWMRREIYLFRPHWSGALMKSKGGFPGVFAHAGGGRSLPSSSGRVFDPTDIEVGPEGALYVLSWGQSYGATIKEGKQVDAGRVYRIRHAASPLADWKREHRQEPITQWSLDELYDDLGSHVPVWRTDAQEELVRRTSEAVTFLQTRLGDEKLTRAERTWTLWTLGRLSPDSAALDAMLSQLIVDRSTIQRSDREAINDIVQALRILAFRIRQYGTQSRLPSIVGTLLTASNPRLRHEAVQAIWQAKQRQWIPDLLELASRETDRVTFYSTWNALRELGTLEDRKSWLDDRRIGVRLAALLGLFEDDAVAADEVLRFRTSTDPRVLALVESWLEKTGGAAAIVEMNPPPGEYTEPISVVLKTSVDGGVMTYTLDGSTPVNTSPRFSGPITINRDCTLRVAVTTDNTQAGRITAGAYRIRRIEPYRHRAFITSVHAERGREYRMDWTGLALGKRHYTDREYCITNVPPELLGAPFLQTANIDDRSTGDEWLTLTSSEDVTVLVGVDVRNNAPLAWMKIGQPDGFEDTGLEVATVDPDFRLYKRDFPAGRIALGGNTNHPSDSGRGNYIVVFQRQLLAQGAERASSLSTQGSNLSGQGGESLSYEVDDVVALMDAADVEHGRELFLHPRGAGCFKCHRMEGRGAVLAPDLSDLGSRSKTPHVLVESILQPSAVITEGFAQQQILTVHGMILSGAVLEETGRSLKLVDSEGKITTVPKADIDERYGTDLSPMPSGFDKLMSTQQLADLTAWLMTQKVLGDPTGFSFRDGHDQLDVYFGKQRIATFLKSHPKLTRRAFINVTTPGGIQVTRNFPPRAPEDIDHPMMHPGIWIGFGDVDGNDYWRLQAEVVFDGFVEPPSGDKNAGGFSVRNLYMREGEGLVGRVSNVSQEEGRTGYKPVLHETTRYAFHRVPEGVLMRIDATFLSNDDDFYFGDQEESGLAVRVASPIRVRGGNGSITNDRGERNAAAMWGKEAKWFDYYGTIDGRQVGLMVVSDPDNPRPSWLHARDYGVVVTNPFPKQPKERREPYVKTWVKKGRPYRLSYAILIHDLPAEKPLDHNAAYEAMLKYFD